MRSMVGSRIIVKKLSADQTKTEGGLYMPNTAASTISRGLVIACPEEFTEMGAVRKTPFKPTDIVAYSTKSGQPIPGETDTFIVEMSAVFYVEN